MHSFCISGKVVTILTEIFKLLYDDNFNILSLIGFVFFHKTFRQEVKLIQNNEKLKAKYENNLCTHGTIDTSSNKWAILNLGCILSHDSISAT